MLKKLIKNNIKIIKQKVSWEEAIKIASLDLINSNSIKQSYVDKMIENVNTIGPYICLAPGFAMPHARPEDGVNKLSMSLALFKEEIDFPDERKAKLLITLAASDSDTHIDAIQSLLELLNKDLQNLIDCENIKEIQEIISKY